MALRIVQISDTHLSERSPEAITNFRSVADWIAADPPDLVVNTGDLSLNGADDATDLVLAHHLHAALTVPWRVVPGNHDVGDIGVDAPQPVDDARRRRFAGVFGDSAWIDERGGWRLIGFDVQTLLAGDAAAANLYTWLDEALRVTTPTAIFTHRPLMPAAPGEEDEPHRYVPAGDRPIVRELLARPQVRLVATGHVHQWRQVEIDDTLHVWAPSAWAALGEDIQPTIGEKVIGVVELVLGDPDQPTVTVRVVTPPGVGQHVLGVTLASPYAH